MAADDDLTRPLGLTSGRTGRGRSLLLGLAGFGLLAAAAGTATYMWLGSTGTGPTETQSATATPVDIRIHTGSTRGALPDDQAPGLVEIKPDGTLTDIGKVVIHDPSRAGTIRLAALPDLDLIEDGPYGPLPRISTSGLRPLEAYARPSPGPTRTDRIAIVIGGIGISPQGTASAIRDLPGTVTLALAPLGEALDEVVFNARAGGHELLLQIPLEPFNYPANDPGPQTLTVAAGAAANINSLHWLLSRATNYIGVMNYLGARFTSDADALTPVLKEIGRRGLLYLDDGSSGRSTAPRIAAGLAPFLRSDVTLDADLNAAAIDRRLDQLQALARERGYAIATGSAFPATVARVADFVERAAERGMQIVPLSALVLSGRS